MEADAQGNRINDTPRPVPGARQDAEDAAQDFSNQSQRNAAEQSDSQTAWEVNRKRTYDAYQDLDLSLARKMDAIFATHLTNSVITSLKLQTDAADNVTSTRAQILKHADVACDGLWTDELNPTMHGAEAEMAGQAPVNSQLASTASLDVAFTNISAQNGQLVAGYVTMAQALAQSNASMAASNAALAAQLSQLTQNAKQDTATPAAKS